MRALTKGLLGIVAAAAIAPLSLGSASAATSTGWIGATPPNASGQTFLTTSTINNSPLSASTRMYTPFGNAVPSGQMGVRARLFKSGALCQITAYNFNSSPASQLSNATAGDCGDGYYNSHGFVRYWNGSDYSEFLTFPSDPLIYPATSSARSTNEQGESKGSAENIKREEDLPDLIEAIGVNGKTGFVKKNDLLADIPATPEQAAAAADPAPRTITVYAADGVTAVDTFRIQ
ncbi:hypothetical protein [Gordonia sp. OPL2]|uniref:hypothetical protein n=1 Tax=Gordonia sp. OPL2 TaxID=2486274 RepID=UPI001655A1B1|nr:hypothetical protein [Gordonia sp. OPL2]ROZ88068.1 hypothetical protein EEB19_22265 [Gordonia sp. OPL2]